jgi:hypothetical protein
MLLLSKTAHKLQDMLWDKTGRPTISKEQEEAFQHNLPDLAEQVIVYLSEHYTENISELRGLFVVETQPQSNDQLIQMMGQLLSNMNANTASSPVSSNTVASAPVASAPTASTIQAQPVTQASTPKVTSEVNNVVQLVVKEDKVPTAQVEEQPTEEIAPDFDAAFDMFGAAFG